MTLDLSFSTLILLHYFNLFALKMHFVKLIGLIIIFPLNFSHQQKLALAISHNEPISLIRYGEEKSNFSK